MLHLAWLVARIIGWSALAILVLALLHLVVTYCLAGWRVMHRRRRIARAAALDKVNRHYNRHYDREHPIHDWF